MSRLNIKKGLDLLLPAFQQYSAQHNDAVLVLAGPDDGYETPAKAFVKENQMIDNVLFTGMLTGDQKLEALQGSDVFVLPSYSEGFSIAVLEAMASHLPCIVSDKVGFAEYIVDYQAATLTDTTVQSLSSCIEKVLLNEPERIHQSQNAYKMLSENFAIEVIAQKMLAAYHDL
jgi:glycosyltransferase involved in cell wall biosynthesis